jgi:hypothetical protein
MLKATSWPPSLWWSVPSCAADNAGVETISFAQERNLIDCTEVPHVIVGVKSGFVPRII